MIINVNDLVFNDYRGQVIASGTTDFLRANGTKKLANVIVGIGKNYNEALAVAKNNLEAAKMVRVNQLARRVNG